MVLPSRESLARADCTLARGESSLTSLAASIVCELERIDRDYGMDDVAPHSDQATAIRWAIERYPFCRTTYAPG
jgi:hypothetical protein